MLPPGLRIILAVEAHQRIHCRGHGPTRNRLARFLWLRGEAVAELPKRIKLLRQSGHIVPTRDQHHQRIELTLRGRFVANDLEDPPDLSLVGAPEGTKTCIDCGAEKPLARFYLLHKGDPSGPRQSRCIPCDNDRRNRDVDHPMWRTA